MHLTTALFPNPRLTPVLPLGPERRVWFYSLYPIYTEERDLEKEKGTEHLVRLFQKHNISTVIDVHRPNVAQ